MKIWIDKNSAPNGYAHCKTVGEAIDFITEIETLHNLFIHRKKSPDYTPWWNPTCVKSSEFNGLLRISIDDAIAETVIEEINVVKKSDDEKEIRNWIKNSWRDYPVKTHPSSHLMHGNRIFVDGSSDELWIEDYNCRVCTYGTLEETPSLNAKKVLITLDDIDGEENVCCRVRMSKLKKV